MTNTIPTVHVVDDDQAFRESTRWLLESARLNVKLYETGQDFLDSITKDSVGCLVTDLRMPNISGVELQRAMKEKGILLPVIIMTAHGDVDTAVQAMKEGAMDFIQKPFNHQTFLDLVNEAINKNVEQHKSHGLLMTVKNKIQSLSRREQDVLNLIVEGKTNKMIAHLLAVSEKTVEAHRANIMQKTQAKSLAELVKMAVSAKELKGIP